MRNHLRRLREDAGMSQQECADALGVTRQTVISIEKGHFDPRLSLAFRISAVFGVRVDAVFVPGDEGALDEGPADQGNSRSPDRSSTPRGRSWGG